MAARGARMAQRAVIGFPKRVVMVSRMLNEPAFLPDDWLIELGKVVKAWITFEKLFDLMLQKLAGYNDPFDPTFTILTAHSSFPQRLDMFKSLCDRHKDANPHLAEYKKIASAISEAQRLRNFFMHNLIGLESDGTVRVSTISARGQLKMDIRPIELQEITDTHGLIMDAGRQVYRLVLNADPWAGEATT